MRIPSFVDTFVIKDDFVTLRFNQSWCRNQSANSFEQLGITEGMVDDAFNDPLKCSHSLPSRRVGWVVKDHKSPA